jgi:3-mercaptopyruvate sulfurtransferase SseA
MKQLKKYRANIRITEAEWIELHQQKGSITQYLKEGKLQGAIIVKENLLLDSNVKDNIGPMEA